MAKTGAFHHVGTFFLFAAAVLLLITTISSPVINDIAIMKVSLTNGSSVTFGSFGYCVRDTAANKKDFCTGKHIGYNPAKVMASIDKTSFKTASEDSAEALTRVMILHPIVAAMAFIAFIFALGAGVCGAIFASLTAALTWILTVVVMATDLVLFGIVRNHINDHDKDKSGSKAKYTVAMWTLIAAMVLLFLSTFIVLFTCFSARRHRNDVRSTKHVDAGYAHGTTTTKRHFWQRRSRY